MFVTQEPRILVFMEKEKEEKGRKKGVRKKNQGMEWARRCVLEITLLM